MNDKQSQMFRERIDVLETFPQIMDFSNYGFKSEEEINRYISFSKLVNMMSFNIVKLGNVSSDTIYRVLSEIPSYIDSSIAKYPEKDKMFEFDLYEKIRGGFLDRQ